MQIGILGPGRLGRSLAVLLRDAGHAVDLQGRGATPRGEVVLLTVPDRAIAAAAATVPAGPVLLHCSGAEGLEVLGPRAPVGSLHPLMTFPGPERALPDLAGVPAAIAGDPEAARVARAIATSLGMRPFDVPGDRRLYHAAAVMAGNFTTVLLAEASRVLVAAGVSPAEAPAVLLPLALQSLRNAVPDPAAALTGPIARGDAAVLDRHRAALAAAGLHDALALYEELVPRAGRLARGEQNPSRRD